jgi:biotin carboxyl carrier protein
VHRKFRITVDGHAYDVIVEEIASDAPPVAPVAHAAAVAVAAAAAPVVAPLAIAGSETAPLAGVVVSIDVAVGQTIAVGARIATIEAMKMKMDVFAKGAGRIVSIAVAAGDSVDNGGVLLTLE